LSPIHAQAPFGISYKNRDSGQLPIVVFGLDLPDSPAVSRKR
jgi:hypothetical protein